MKKIQFGAELIIPNKKSNGSKVLKYSLIESPVGFGYSRLKNYGIEILCTDRIPGLKDMSECKQIEGIFFDVEEAVSFLAKIKKEAIMPSKLSQRLEEYISDKIRKQRELYRVNTAVNP